MAERKRVAKRPRVQTKPKEDPLASLTPSLKELVYLARTRAGFTAQEDLAIAARALTPSNMRGLNRRFIQALEHGDLSREEIPDLWLLAIALACKVKPDVFGLAPGESDQLDTLLDMLKRGGWK